MDFSTSCTCRIETCGQTLERLTARIRVLETSTGWTRDPEVVRACLFLQAMTRTFLARTQRRRQFSKFFRKAASVARGRRALIHIQSHVRHVQMVRRYRDSKTKICKIQARFRTIRPRYGMTYRLMREISRLESEIEKDQIVIRRYQALLASRRRSTDYWVNPGQTFYGIGITNTRSLRCFGSQ